MDDKLWGDLKTLQEFIDFMVVGRAWETGIMAKAIVDDVVAVYSECLARRQWMTRDGEIGGNEDGLGKIR